VHTAEIKEEGGHGDRERRSPVAQLRSGQWSFHKHLECYFAEGERQSTVQGTAVVT
jgi:hypothetical protein